MKRQYSLPIAFVLAILGASACEVEEPAIAELAQALEFGEAPATPPGIQPVPLKTITVWDFHGVKQNVQISSGNAEPASNWSSSAEPASSKLSYLVSAAGASYTLSFRHDGPKRLVVEAITSTQDGPAVIGKMIYERDVGTTLEYLGDPVAPGNVMGPFLVNNGNVMSDINLYLLLDHQVLGFLPRPNRLHGISIGADAAKKETADALYKTLVGNHTTLWQASKFRFDVTAMSAADRAALVPIMQTYINANDNWLRHMEVDHTVAIAAPVADSDPDNSTYALGGFFNGHRNFMGEMEAYFKQDNVALDEVLPFRRLPVWRPDTTVPAEFQISISNSTPAVPIPAPLSHGPTICGNYANVNELLSKAVSGETLNVWHGQVHTTVGGTFGAFHEAAKAPLFWTWHTTVDTIWANWQHCRKLVSIAFGPTVIPRTGAGGASR